MDSLLDKFASLRNYETEANETVIRRYLDSDKLNDLLISRELYFSPASKFPDIFEGNYTTLDHHVSDRKLERLGLEVAARRIAEARKTNSS